MAAQGSQGSHPGLPASPPRVHFAQTAAPSRSADGGQPTAAGLCSGWDLPPQCSCPDGNLSLAKMVRKVSPLAMSLRWGRDPRPLPLSWGASCRTKGLAGSRAVRKMNAVPLVPRPSSLSQRQLLDCTALQIAPGSPVPAFRAAAPGSSEALDLFESLPCLG